MRTTLGFLLATVLILGGGAALFAYVQSTGMGWPEKLADTWKDILELSIIFVAAIVGLIQLGLLLHQAHEHQREVIEENRKERARRTLEMDAKLTEDKVQARRRAIQAVWRVDANDFRPIPLAEVQQAFRQQKELEGNLYDFLGLLDALSLPILAKVADERMAFEMFGTTLVWYGIAFGEHIKQMQDSHLGWCCNLEVLAPRWQQKLEAEKGLPPYYARFGMSDMDDASYHPWRRPEPRVLAVAGRILSWLLAGALGAVATRYLWP